MNGQNYKILYEIMLMSIDLFAIQRLSVKAVPTILTCDVTVR